MAEILKSSKNEYVELDSYSIAVKISKIQIMIPKQSELNKRRITLKDLVEYDLLEIGSKIQFSFQKKIYCGGIEKEKENIYLVYSENGKEIKDVTPSEWISKVDVLILCIFKISLLKIVEPEIWTGYSWNSVRLLNGTSLQQLKNDFLCKFIGNELMR
jgi:hypothetical protein